MLVRCRDVGFGGYDADIVGVCKILGQLAER
jgi:hypothetical protein